jgi:hypothetical protein
MTTKIEAWVIYAESPGAAPRSADDPLFPWAWKEAIAVLPGDATPAERAAALAVVAQVTHLAGGEREDALQFTDRSSYFYELARQDYFDGLHPYLAISPARNVRNVKAGPGEARDHIAYEVIPASDLRNV